MKNTMVIINPKQKEELIKKITKLLIENEFKNIFICKDKYELKTVVKFFYQNQNYNYLLIWGGDGTVHKVVNYLTKISNKSTSNIRKAIGFLKVALGMVFRSLTR